jgi:hypothetical protein
MKSTFMTLKAFVLDREEDYWMAKELYWGDNGFHEFWESED